MISGEILNSWKEIATYVGRGVRTIQRWEQSLDFPVHRPHGRARSAVIALKPEIDRWLRMTHVDPHANHFANWESQSSLIEEAKLLLSETEVLVARSLSLRKQLARTKEMGAVLRTSCMVGRTDMQNWVDATKTLRLEIERAMQLGSALHRNGRSERKPHLPI